MVQLLFVHGVNTRKDAAYDAVVAEIARRFSTVSFSGASFEFRAPYWGGFGAPALYDCIPKIDAKATSLSLADAKDPSALLEAARVDLGPVVAALSAAALEEARGANDEAAKLEAERLWLGAAHYAEQRPNVPWINQVADDEQFIDRLIIEARAMQPPPPAGVPAGQDLGLGDTVKALAAKVKGGLSNLANAPLARVARESVSPRVAVFIGDVFRYLKDGSARDSIRDVVIGDIVAAAKAQGNGEKLVLAGHSMGAVILYDIVSDAAAVAAISARIGRPLAVDLFLSIGSQVALFEELKVYEASGQGIAAGAKVARPAPCALWWNIFDKMDVLSFLCEPVFDNVTDFAMDTIAGVIDAHGAYFDSMPFYARLAKRLKSAGLV